LVFGKNLKLTENSAKIIESNSLTFDSPPWWPKS